MHNHAQSRSSSNMTSLSGLSHQVALMVSTAAARNSLVLPAVEAEM